MDSITVENFRCFGEKQTARLAPLTLLVGDNSTGKTSFLAVIRALWDVAYRQVVPNFREQPYDLGSFGDILHDDGNSKNIPTSFEVGFKRPSKPISSSERLNGNAIIYDFTVTFENSVGAPYPVRRRASNGVAWIDYLHRPDGGYGQLKYGTDGVSSSMEVPGQLHHFLTQLFPLSIANFAIDMLEKSQPIGIADAMHRLTQEQDLINAGARPFASAPIRSRPSRTYDPIPISSDSEGDDVPTYLARTSMAGDDQWEELQGHLVDFGRNSGLFDDIQIEHLGRHEGSPFQIQVRKQGRRRKGSYRNLVDMGYGVSQVLPILTELLRKYGPSVFLLQQPEVHLHPSAQAALGTLFCSTAASGKQIIVETHGDHIIDRVRMDVRDGTTDLSHDDVSILFFERRDSDVRIHSIGIDEHGEIYGAPRGYRQFFMDEVNRSIGFVPLDV